MPYFDTRPSRSEYEGCLTALELWVDKEGELTREELREIDDVMGSIGSESTGWRINIRGAGTSTAKVKYVYQERLMSTSLENAKERLAPPFGPFESPTIFIGTEVVNLVEGD
jgi:hypothetical protein